MFATPVPEKVQSNNSRFYASGGLSTIEQYSREQRGLRWESIRFGVIAKLWTFSIPMDVCLALSNKFPSLYMLLSYTYRRIACICVFYVSYCIVVVSV